MVGESIGGVGEISAARTADVAASTVIRITVAGVGAVEGSGQVPQAVDIQGLVLHVRQPPVNKRIVTAGTSAVQYGQTLHPNDAHDQLTITNIPLRLFYDNRSPYDCTTLPHDPTLIKLYISLSDRMSGGLYCT